MSYNHFFVFGCWNRDNCSGDKLDYRKAVVDKILVKKNYFDFGIIAGDNIYPHKSIKDKKEPKKVKNYYESTLDYGFNLIKQLKYNTKKHEIYGTIGNHDIDLPNILRKQIETKVLTMPNNVFTNYYNNNLRIVYIDTNLFDKGWDELDKTELFTFKNNNGGNFYNIKNTEALKEYLNMVKKEIFNGWTIIIGHEPIISIKSKDYGEKITNWHKFTEILELIASIPKAVYMCADVHSFQAWNITTKDNNNLPMIVVGTGGAEPDATININKKYDHEGNIMNLLATEYPYGYCDVSYNQNDLIITYIPVNYCTESNIKYTFNYTNNKLKLVKEKTQKYKPCIAKETNARLCERPYGLITGGNSKLYNEIYGGIYNLLSTNKDLIPKGYYI